MMAIMSEFYLLKLKKNDKENLIQLLIVLIIK